LNTVGYKEVIAHIKGQLEYERMVELIKQNTRRFAKRQLTWFRRDERIRWIAMDEKTPIEHATETIMQEFRPS
jgi:tRNA dimethylallyltransferase